MFRNKKSMFVLLPLLALVLAGCGKKTVDPTSVVVSSANDVHEIIVGETLQLSATVLPEGAKQDVVWTTTKEDVATVNAGLVTAVSVGSVEIKAIAKDFDTVIGKFDLQVKAKDGNGGETEKTAQELWDEVIVEASADTGFELSLLPFPTQLADISDIYYEDYIIVLPNMTEAECEEYRTQLETDPKFELAKDAAGWEVFFAPDDAFSVDPWPVVDLEENPLGMGLFLDDTPRAGGTVVIDDLVEGPISSIPFEAILLLMPEYWEFTPTLPVNIPQYTGAGTMELTLEAWEEAQNIIIFIDGCSQADIDAYNAQLAAAGLVYNTDVEGYAYGDAELFIAAEFYADENLGAIYFF